MRATRPGRASAVCTATKPPRLDPISTNGSSPASSIAAVTWPIMRVIVKVEKSGRLKSGECSVTPCSENFAARKARLLDCGDDAKP